jgi:hypothetical protein
MSLWPQQRSAGADFVAENLVAEGFDASTSARRSRRGDFVCRKMTAHSVRVSTVSLSSLGALSKWSGRTKTVHPPRGLASENGL